MSAEKKKSSVKNEANKPPPTVVFAPFIEIIVSAKFELVSALANITLTKEAGNQIADALLNIFEIYSDSTFELMKWAISIEIEQETAAPTLLRGATFATRLLSAFYKKVADSYLKSILGPLMTDIAARGSLEIDPLKASPTDNIEENYKKVQELSEQVLDRILNSVDQLPGSIKQLLSFAKEKVNAKFPEASAQTIIGGSIFLRFICPAIVAPQESGLTSEPLSSEARRGLVLISKLLQNLANELPFEMKESFMLPFNQFITDNIPKIREFFAQITQPPTKKEGADFAHPSDEVIATSLQTLHGIVVDNREKIDKYLDQMYPSNFVSNFKPKLDEALSAAGSIKKKKTGFFGRPKSRTSVPPSEEELHLIKQKSLLELKLFSSDSKLSPLQLLQERKEKPEKEKTADTNTPDSHEIIEKQMRSTCDVFVNYFKSKLKEKEKQLKDALDANASLQAALAPAELNSTGKKEEKERENDANRPLNSSGSNDARDDEVARLLLDNADLAKKVELLHGENCKLRDQIKSLSQQKLNSADSLQLSQTTFDLVVQTKAELAKLSLLVEDKKKSREVRKAKKSKSKLDKLLEGMDSAKQARILEQFEKLVAQDGK